jgi:predicted DCC family thiol-disulfide oxidoreductase YuxK
MKNINAQIYFDGLCLACSAEMNHYRKLPGSEKFIFTDITDPSFIAADHGLDPKQVHKVMHVRDVNGQLQTGVDAFRAIWQVIPKYQFLYRYSENTIIRSLLNIGYNGFVIIRPFLPRKKADCASSPYCEVKHD